jgi:ABC-type Zn uptake system ZnuABC Zn-binding protein ZnuA
MRTIDVRERPGRLVFMLLVISAPAVGCAASGSTGRDGDDGRVAVVTTVSPITNIVQNVGGSAVAITGIVPEGANSHTFEPAPSDAALMEQADIVFMNGLHLEEPTLELAEANASDDVPIVQLGEMTIGPDEYIFDFSYPKAEGDPNPHLWTNPEYVSRYAQIVGRELTSIDPDNAAMYERNVEAFVARIDELGELVREVTETVPPANRALLTYHDSFPYFAREYGWRIIGAVQPSDFSDPTPQEVAGLIDQIHTEHIPAIFGSEVFPSPVLEQIAAETGATYVDDLRDDDLPGEVGDPGHSYLGLMVFDYTTFMSALGGDAAPLADLDVSNLHEGNAEYRS